MSNNVAYLTGWLFRLKKYEKRTEKIMKFYLFLITAFLVLMPIFALTQTDKKQTADEKAIRRVVQNIADAWAAGDGVKFADNFPDDVDYTVWNGHQIHGREENIAGHQQIFDTFYKGTIIKSDVKKIRFLTDNVVAVHLQSKMYKDGKLVEDVPTVLPLLIFKKENGKWRVAVFQNTPLIRQGELVVGRKSENEKK